MRTIIQSFKYAEPLCNAFRSLGFNTHIWDERYKPAFDLFAEFQPELVICKSDCSNDLVKCIAKYKTRAYCFVSSGLNQYVVPHVHSFFTDNPGVRLNFDARLKYLPPAFDHTVYKPSQALGGTFYVGNYDDSLHWLLWAISDTRIRILGQGWPLRSLGQFLPATELRALSGPVVCYTMQQTLKTLACGGAPIVKFSEETAHLPTFSSYEEMLEQIKKPRKIHFDIEPHTYVERVKELLA